MKAETRTFLRNYNIQLVHENMDWLGEMLEEYLEYAATHQEGGECYVECAYKEAEYSAYPHPTSRADQRVMLKKKAALPQISDWDKLREKYFEECVSGYAPKDATGFHPLGKELKSVAMAPHDLFEWFKRNLPNTQISEGEIDQAIHDICVLEERLTRHYHAAQQPMDEIRKLQQRQRNAITQLMKGGEG